MEEKEQNRKVELKENQREEDGNQEKDSEHRNKGRKGAEAGTEDEYVSTKYQWSNCDVSACYDNCDVSACYDKEYYAEK